MEITYKFVMDGQGNLKGVELWQNGQHVTVSMMHKSPTPDSSKWVEVKEFMDSVTLPVLDINDAITTTLREASQDGGKHNEEN